jgi:hypothetical protein
LKQEPHRDAAELLREQAASLTDRELEAGIKCKGQWHRGHPLRSQVFAIEMKRRLVALAASSPRPPAML